MAGLLDFLQSASNAAASNVSAPVDGLAWALRKLGAPIPANPVGGSDWMAEKGLTKPVAQSGYSLAGESMGMIAPMLAAAKAPQIAKGLLQGAENLAAPRTLNPQAGAVVWHGSPHKFDKFDAGKIGTGEGAQVYGHGLYLADSDTVAKSYATGNQGRAAAASGLIDKLPEPVQMDLYRAMNMRDGWIKDAQLEDIFTQYPAARAVAQEKSANLYKVDLPDQHIAKMLDYDNAVPESVRQPLSKAALDQFGSGLSMGQGSQLLKQVADEFKFSKHPDPNAAAAEWLRTQGVPGVRYLDGSSRGTGAGSSNYVVFPGNEGLLSILERNGQPLK